ncbi:MAG: distal tail protein Dit [Lachnospiraceae bacterium]
MYDFIDTTQAQASAGSSLPAEAMSYNGVYLENEIAGYRTLSVSGRELMGSEVKDETKDGIDGSKYISKRYPARTITVKYMLSVSSDSEFRNAFNKMNQLLSAEQVKIIFNDEPDKYFIGTKVGNTEVDSGRNTVTGEIEIYCTDPRKYSLSQKEFIASVNSDGVLEAIVQNKGTVPVSVDYEIVNNAETGYIGIVSDNGVMQYGKIDEADGENYQQNEKLVTIEDFINSPDDITGTDIMHPTYGAKGTLSTATWFGKRFLAFGTKGDTVGNANGGLRTITIPADSNGDTGCKNFYTYLHLIFYAGLMGQTGEMCINWMTADNKMIAGLNWYKTDTSGNTGCYELWANGKILKTYKYTTSHLSSQNPWYWDWGHCDLRKEGSKLTFFYWGGYPSFVVPEVENMECTKIQIAMKQWGNRSGSQFMTFMGIDTFNFSKMHVEKWRDVPNRYPEGSVCRIDGEDSHFYVNDMHTTGDEILGTQYFKAPPGESTIKFYTSEWTTQVPTVKVKIREAWL